MNDHVSLHRALVAAQHAHTGRVSSKPVTPERYAPTPFSLMFWCSRLGHFKVQRRHDLVGRWIMDTFSPAETRFFLRSPDNQAAAHDGGALFFSRRPWQ